MLQGIKFPTTQYQNLHQNIATVSGIISVRLTTAYLKIF